MSLRCVIVNALKIRLGLQGASQREVRGYFFGYRGVGSFKFWLRRGCVVADARPFMAVSVHTIRAIHAALVAIVALGK
jgi:hypothetical protein